MDDFKRGRVDRRGVLSGLGALAAAPLVRPLAAAAEESTPIVKFRSINHVHFDVSDIKRSADFYAVMFGAKVREKSKTFWTIQFPTDTNGYCYWASLNRAPLEKPSDDGGGVKPGHYSHMGLGIDLVNPQETARISDIINKRYPTANARVAGAWNDKNEFPGGRSVYMKDPWGLIIQLVRPTDDGYLFPGSRDEAAPAWTPPAEKPLLQFRNINHMHFDVGDVEKAAQYYKELLGATFKDKSPSGGYTVVLPNSTPGRAHWFSLSKAPKDKPSADGSGVKPGEYAHMGLGVVIDDGANSTAKLSEAINKRFPFANAKPTGPGTRDGKKPGERSIYMRDPDGLIIQLNRPDDDGWLPQAT